MSFAGEVVGQFLNNTEEEHPFLEACTDAKTPFSLMYIGSFISCFVTILFVHADTFGYVGRLMFWIFMFMLFMMQLYGDMLDLSEAMTTFTEGTDIFNCYARIVVNSANFKWSVCSTLCSLSSEAFQNPDKSSKIKFSDAFNRKKLKKRFYADPVSEIFLIGPFIITSLMTFPIFFSHVVWGQINYCWFTMLMWMCSDMCISCGRCCCRPKSKLDPDGIPMKKTKFQLVLTVVFLLWQLGSYSMVYYIGTVIPVNFVSLHGIPLSENYTMTYENASSYLEAVIQTWDSRSLEEYNEKMVFGLNATTGSRIEYFWVIV